MVANLVFDDATKQTLSLATQKTLILSPQLLAKQESIPREYHKHTGGRQAAGRAIEIRDNRLCLLLLTGGERLCGVTVLAALDFHELGNYRRT